MRFGRYRFYNIVLNAGELTGSCGSALRGSFGHALRAISCTAQDRQCNICQESDSCLYAKVFELKARNQDDVKPLVAAPPHPYVIEPPLQIDQTFVAGDAFAFDLLLFGNTNDHLADLIDVVERMGVVGIRTSGDLIHFALSEVVAEDQTIYRKSNGKLSATDWTRPLQLDPTEHSVAGNLEIQLMTPLRLKVDGRYTDRLPFQTLVRALLRRATILSITYGQGKLPFDYRVLLNKASEVETIAENLQWQDFSRNSSRQKRKMEIGGIIGNISYRGQLEPFLPLIDFCKETHIGKQTTFGLGKFDYSWQEEAV